MLIPSDPVHAFVDYPDVPVAHAASGPLAGVTFAVKDIYDVAGYPTGCGSPEKTAEDPVPTTHAAPVAKLLDAGAAFAGKTHTAELAFSLDGRNEHYGTPLNPAAPGRVPGGSSSGSAAAVAAGLVDLALGSDTGGSVRGPASFCGIIGLRPTFDRIDISGTMPLASIFDTVGWFTRSIDLYARVGAVLLGDDVAGPPLARMVVADYAVALFAQENDVAALMPAIARVAAHLKSDGGVTVAEGDGLERWYRAYRTMQGYHAWRAHGAWIERRKPALNPAVVSRFAAARAVTQDAYDTAVAFRAVAARRVADLVGDDRVIALPTMPGIAPRLDASEETFEGFRGRAVSMLCMAGLAGLPQISLPLMTVDGCPVGLSLIGPRGRDRALIELAGRILAG
jgi:amidase